MLLRVLRPPALRHARFGARLSSRAALRVPRPTSLASIALAATLVGLTLGAGVAASRSARAPAHVTRLAWFYMRNNDGTSPAALVARNKVMILSGSDREVGFLQKVRRAGWRKPILEYFDTAFAAGPSSAANGGPCPRGFEGLSTSVTWQRNDFCNLVNPHESWFLHNGAGKRIYRNAYSGAYLYLMNPASSGWRAFVQAKLRQAPRHFHMDGFFLDDVWQTADRPRSREDTSDGTCRECGSNAQWRKGYLGFLRAVKRAAGKRPVWINSDNSRSFVHAVDGGMIENMGASWGSSFMPQSEIESRWRDIDRNVAARKNVLLVGQGDSRDQIDRMRFANAVYLMVAGPRVSFRFQNADNYREFWDYPEYRLRMGAPTARRHRIGGSVWLRRFAAGISVVNLSASRSQTVSLGGAYVLPDGRRAAAVTLGPHEGLAAVRAR